MAAEWHSKQFAFCSCQPYPQPSIRNLIWAKSSKQYAIKCTFVGHAHGAVPSGSSGRHGIITEIIVKAHEYCLICLIEGLWCILRTFAIKMIWNLLFRSSYTFWFIKSKLHSCWVTIVRHHLIFLKETQCSTCCNLLSWDISSKMGSHLHHIDSH
jgi:hypothetical protein